MRVEFTSLEHDIDLALNNYLVFTRGNNQHFLVGEIYYVYDYNTETNVLYLDEDYELFFEIGYKEDDDSIALFTTLEEAQEAANEYMSIAYPEEEEEEEYDRIYKVGSYVSFVTDEASINYKVTDGMIIPESATLECWDYIYDLLGIAPVDIDSFVESNTPEAVVMHITEDYQGYYLENDEYGESTDALINLLKRECAVRRNSVITIDARHGDNVVVNKNLSPKEMLYNSTDLDSLKIEKLTIY